VLGVTPNPKDTSGIRRPGLPGQPLRRPGRVGVAAVSTRPRRSRCWPGGGRIADSWRGTVTGRCRHGHGPDDGGSGSDVSSSAWSPTPGARRRSRSAHGRWCRHLGDGPAGPDDVPADITAYTALDVLSHGIESYVSKAANFLSDVQALAPSGCHRAPLPGPRPPGDVQARDGLARASCSRPGLHHLAARGTHAISTRSAPDDLPHGC